MTLSATDLHTQQAWEFWRKLGSPKHHVAPMVDQVPVSTVSPKHLRNQVFVCDCVGPTLILNCACCSQS